MYNLSEYILAKRSAYIIEKLIERNASYTSFREKEKLTLNYENYKHNDLYNMQKKLEFLFEAIYPGSIVKRFVSINTNHTAKVLPITLLEILEPSHVRIPIIITEYSILAISPFGNIDMEGLSNNRWLNELMPSSILESMNKSTIIETLSKPLQINEDPTNCMTVEEAIKLIMTQYTIGVTTADKVLTSNFEVQSAMEIMEVSPESAIFKHIDKNYGTESILGLDTAAKDEVISPTDFLPIQLEVDGTNSLIYVETNKGKLSVSTNPQNREYPHQTTVKVPESAKNTILIELDTYAYFKHDDILVIEFLDNTTTELSLFEVTATNEELQTAHDLVGAEGFIGTMKDAMSAIRIFGLRKGSLLYQVMMNITKIPRKIAAWVWAALKRSLKTRNQLEKEEMLHFQEKLLNDEFDIILEKIKYLGENGVRAWVWTVILGPLYFLPFMYMLKRNANRSVKLRAIERLEFKIDGLLERHDQKLEYAKQEGDPEVVDRLLAEKHNMEFARLKLIEFKRDLVQKDRIRYMTFNKDLSMNGRQRIDALMQSGSYFNIGHSNGQGYTVETRIPGDF